MTYTIEVLLKGRQHPITEQVAYDGPEPPRWTDADVRHVLRTVLLTFDQVQNPGTEERTIALRGLSWIVTPLVGGVAIAIEIPSGAVVAGPFEIAETRLTEMVARVLRDASGESSIVH